MKARVPILFLSLLLFMVYWQWWIGGPKVAIDFPIVSHDQLLNQLDLPRIWAEKDVEGLGEYSVFTLWSWPFNLISGILANLGLGFAIQERLLWIIPFLLFGIFGIWKLCKELNLSNYARSVAALFYLSNTYILLVIDGGQLSIALGYSWLPISFLAIKKSINASIKWRIIAGGSVWILGIFDIRIIFILFVLILLYFLYWLLFLSRKERFKWILGWLRSGVVCIIVLVGLNAYWLIPYILDPIPSSTYQKLTQSNFQGFINLGHGLLMLAPHWYKNVFGNIAALQFEFLLIPILVFLIPILRPKNKIVGFWILVALIGIFLAKGASEPFPKVYQWFFINIPGFSLFRDSSKFFFLVALSYSVLLGISIDEITKKIESFKYLFLILTILYLIFLIRPVWLNQMTGTFSEPPFQKEYSELSRILEGDNKYSRVFWIPTIAPLANLTSTHPSVEASRLVQKRPFAIGTIGAYEIFNFLREAPFMGEIFDVSGIGYIAYPYLDTRREDPHPDKFKYYDTFSGQLTKLPWLSRVWESSVPLWKVKQYQEKFFVTDNVWLVLGSDHIYNEATKSAKPKLSDNALIFVDEHPGLGNAIDKLPKAKIVLGNKTTTDLAASFIDSSNLIFPAKNLGYDPDQSGWWKREASDLIRWRDFLQTKYGIDNLDFDLGGGWAVGEGNIKLKIKNEKLKIGQVLVARVLESTRSGSLKFYQDDNLIGEINTQNEGNNIRWFEVGQLPENEGKLEIRSAGDINVVNALAILDAREWLGFKKKADSLSDRISDFSEENTHETNTTLTYQQINPTKYKVYIRNLTEPVFLVFSQTFDNNWNMFSQQALPVYSLLNGFRIERDGIYEVNFSPQKWVYPGIVISLLTFLAALFILISSRFKVKS